MIKFKQILQKAAGQSGSAGGMMPFIIASSSLAYQPTRESAVAVENPPTAPPMAPAPEAVGAVVRESPPAANAVSDEFVQSILDQVAEEEPQSPAVTQPAAAEVSSPEMSAAPIEKHTLGARAHESVISEELVASVLEQIAAEERESAVIDGPAVEAPPEQSHVPSAPVATSPDAGVRPEESALLVEPFQDETPSRPTGRSSYYTRDDSTVETMLGEVFNALSQIDTGNAHKEVDAKPILPPEQTTATEDSSEDERFDTDGSKKIDEEFISEVDKLLGAFGRTGDTIQAAAMGKFAGGQPRTADDIEKSVADTIEALAESAGGRSEKAAPGDLWASATARAADSRPDSDARQPEDMLPEDQRSDAAAGSPSIVSKEEQEALFAPENDDRQEPGVDQFGDALKHDVDQMAAVRGTSGKPAEMELDFTAAAMGIEEPADRTSEVPTDDLLSRVLADIEKLGPVEKPAREIEREEPAQPEEVEDFSKILGELNAEQALAQPDATAAVPAQPAVRPKAVEVASSSLTEDEIIDDAIKAADEPHVTEAEDSAEAAVADVSRPDLDLTPAPEGGGSAKEKTPPAGKPGMMKDQPPSEPPRDTEDASAKAEKEAFEDETTLLANLEASMEVAAKQAREESEKAAAFKEEHTQEDQQTLEDQVRNQVLSRSKEVEQKILDDVFGEKKDYKAQIRTEMSGIEAAKENRQRDGEPRPDALSTGSHVAFEGTLSAPAGRGSAAAFDGRPGVFWLAYQINRPFRRWLTPPVLKLLGALSLALLATALLWLAASLVQVWYSL